MFMNKFKIRNNTKYLNWAGLDFTLTYEVVQNWIPEKYFFGPSTSSSPEAVLQNLTVQVVDWNTETTVYKTIEIKPVYVSTAQSKRKYKYYFSDGIDFEQKARRVIISFEAEPIMDPIKYFTDRYIIDNIDYSEHINVLNDTWLLGANTNESMSSTAYQINYNIPAYNIPTIVQGAFVWYESTQGATRLDDALIAMNTSDISGGGLPKVNWDSFYNLHESLDPNDDFSCIIKQENNYFISSEESGYFMNTSTISTQPNKTPIILTKKNVVPRPCTVEMSSSNNEIILKDTNGVIVPALDTSASNSLINLTGTIINTAAAQKWINIKLWTLVSKVNNQDYEFKGLKIFDSECTKYLIAEDLNSLGSTIWLKGDTKKEDIKSLCKDTFKSTGIPKTIAGLVWAGGGGGGHGGFAAHYGGGGGGGGCAKVLLSICDDVEYIIALGAGGDGKGAKASGNIGHDSLIKIIAANDSSVHIALSITGGNGGGSGGTGGSAGEATISTEYVKSKYINATKLIAGRGGDEYNAGTWRAKSSLPVVTGTSSNYEISTALGGSTGGNSGGGGASIGKGGNSTTFAGGNGLLGGGGAGCSAGGGSSGDGGPGGCIFWF